MGCGSGMTCWRRLYEWQKAGVWSEVSKVLLAKLPEADKIDWSRALVGRSTPPAPSKPISEVIPQIMEEQPPVPFTGSITSFSSLRGRVRTKVSPPAILASRVEVRTWCGREKETNDKLFRPHPPHTKCEGMDGSNVIASLIARLRRWKTGPRQW